MPRVNLLREIENIRNTVTPDTRAPRRGRGGARATALLLALLAAGAVYAALQMGITVEPGPAYYELAEAVKGLTGTRQTETASPPAPNMEQEVAALVEQTAVPAPDEKAMAEPAATPSLPAQSAKPAPVSVLPAAPEAQPPSLAAVKAAPAAAPKTTPPVKTEPVPAPAMKHEAAPAPVTPAQAAPDGGWRLRFGVCMLKQSCEGIVSRLTGMGVPAVLERGAAEITTHRLTVGPWTARAQAESAQTALAAAGVAISLQPAGSGYHGQGGPFATAALAEQAAKTARERGYPANAVKARGVVEVYKVYGERFDTRASAARACEGLGRGGVDCFAEEAR